MNLSMKQKQTHKQKTDLCLQRGSRDWGGKDWEFGISRCKLLCIGWINSKVLLYSTGNYIQYPVINHNGKGHKKECIYIYKNKYSYIYIYMNHFAVQKKVPQHYKSTILQ